MKKREDLSTKWAGQEWISLETVDSTNLYAKRIEKTAKHGTLILAEEQEQGRGRRGRTWSSPKGEQIAMTLFLRPNIKLEHASRLTLLMALAVRRGIFKLTKLDCKIKWPNDIVLNGKKICGILTEMNVSIQKIDYVLIGVGINVKQQYFSEELSQIASSLYLESGTLFSRTELVSRILEEFEELYELFLQTEDLSKVCEEYNKTCINCGRQIQVLEPENTYVGTTNGINEKGELLVQKEDGSLIPVYAGEVSVRGLYGYV